MSGGEFNKVLLIGRVREAPVEPKAGKARVLRFKVSTRSSVSGEADTLHTIVLRGELADVAGIECGRIVYVEGELNNGEIEALQLRVLGVRSR